MAFIPLTEDQWVFCQILYKIYNNKEKNYKKAGNVHVVY